MPLVSEADVRALNPRHPLDGVGGAVAAWIAWREGRLLLLLQMQGVDTAALLTGSEPAGLLAMLREGIANGAAANLEGAPPLGQSPDRLAADVAFYEARYQAVYDELQRLTRLQLIGLGAPMVPIPVATISAPTFYGRAGSDLVRPAGHHWYDSLGWRLE